MAKKTAPKVVDVYQGITQAVEKRAGKVKDPKALKSRIKEFRYVSVRDLMANRKNWRQHPNSQMTALYSVLKTVGFVSPLIARELPDGKLELLDGHGRLTVSEKSPDTKLPVVIVDVSDEEADIVLATYDPLSGMAEGDTDLLSALLANVKIPDGLELDKVFSGENSVPSYEVLTERRPDSLVYTGPDLSGYNEYEYLRPQFVPSAAAYGIPELRRDMLAEIPDPLLVVPMFSQLAEIDDGKSVTYCNYGTASMWSWPVERTLVGFYTDDDKLDDLWTSPGNFLSNMLTRKFRLALTPNYSCFPLFPKAFRIHQTYKSRWLGRLMQELGIKVIPDIEFGVGLGTWKDDLDFVLTGIPKNPPAIAFQAQNLGGQEPIALDEYKRGIDRAVRELNPDRVLLYGRHRGELVAHKDWRHKVMNIPAAMEVRSQVVKRFRAQKKAAYQAAGVKGD